MAVVARTLIIAALSALLTLRLLLLLLHMRATTAVCRRSAETVGIAGARRIWRHGHHTKGERWWSLRALRPKCCIAKDSAPESRISLIRDLCGRLRASLITPLQI